MARFPCLLALCLLVQPLLACYRAVSSQVLRPCTFLHCTVSSEAHPSMQAMDNAAHHTGRMHATFQHSNVSNVHDCGICWDDNHEASGRSFSKEPTLLGTQVIWIVQTELESYFHYPWSRNVLKCMKFWSKLLHRTYAAWNPCNTINSKTIQSLDPGMRWSAIAKLPAGWRFTTEPMLYELKIMSWAFQYFLGNFDPLSQNGTTSALDQRHWQCHSNPCNSMSLFWLWDFKIACSCFRNLSMRPAAWHCD